MARENLKAELERYLALGLDDARAEMAKLYQQELVLHVDDWTDSMFKSWDSQGQPTVGPPSPRTDKRTKNAKTMKAAFDKGGNAVVNALYKRLGKMKPRSKGKGVGMSYAAMTPPKIVVQKSKGMVAIYLLSPGKLNWEDKQFHNAVTDEKSKGVDIINDELKKANIRTLRKGQGGAGADLWGHHGGITGADPKSTYGLAGITKASQKLGKKKYNPYAVVDENNSLTTYSDVFWRKLGKEIKARGYWDAKQHVKRPTGLTAQGDAILSDTHTMRIVLGHKGLAGFMGGFDKGGTGWTKLGPVLDKLLNEIQKNVEADIIQQFKKDARKIPDMKGSESPRTRVGKLAAESVVRNLVRGAKKGGKGSKGSVKVTFKVDPVKKSGKRKSKVTANDKSKGGKNKTVSRPGARVVAKVKKPAKGQTKSRSSVSMNPIGLQQLLNKALPEEVMKNMGPYPRRLENRTGRFAGSAEVTQVVPMPNSVEIRYDYMQDPYRVFEPGSGNPLASPGRDPRKLIGGTIRELAQSIMGTKYGLVRTKRV